LYTFQILTVSLYAVAIFVLFVYGVNLLILSLVHAFRERERSGHARLCPEPPVFEASLPFVTVQLPIYNEFLVVERLIDACAAFDYPKDLFEIQVLDDSTDATSIIAAESARKWKMKGVDIFHVRRSARDGYKAGALQNGLSSARGELIAIFDADFVPERDFLTSLVAHFADPSVGMVQARWGHINGDHSLLTRIQAFGLDMHFAIEQRVRSITGCFINFNGTAGIWRRSCINDAGGWSSDTLTEDFDLSYRAQLRGWKFVFVPEVEAPAELPVSINAFRDQQFRWTKGALQTALKTLGPLWKSRQLLYVKLEGSLHLTANLVFPFIVLAALFHAPLAYLQHEGFGPGNGYFAFLSIGLIGFLGFYLAQLFAQRSLYPDWSLRMRLFPLFMAGGIGMSLNNSRAFIDVIAGRRTPFVRTPKHAMPSKSEDMSWWTSSREHTKIPGIAFAEAVFGIYSVAGLLYMIAIGAWAALPFQAVFATGFLFASGYNLSQARLAKRRGVRLPSPGTIM